nr:MAG TPA: tail protein [Caudoviricetes sp.]
MPLYNSNILPRYSSWSLTNASVGSTGSLTIAASGGKAVYTFNTTKYTAQNYMLISCAGCTGKAFFHVAYQDIESKNWYMETIAIPADGLNLPIILQEATTNQVIFTVTSHSSATVQPMSAQLIEQAIRSVDIQYASGTSRVTPPTDGWQSTPPAWQSNRFIWQRTATTFVDGHTEYSNPVCLQNTTSVGIYKIVEEYYLSTSETSITGGNWSTTQPTWQSGKYIWTRSKITWTDQTTTTTDPVLARALNQANKHADDAMDAVGSLDNALDQEGIFNRLTNNGKAQGLYIDNGNIYVNATYIRSGRLEVLDSAGSLVFRADMTSRSVYLAGFIATNNSLYYARPALITNASGIYLGNKGISTGGSVDIPNAGHVDLFIAMSSGVIYGGRMSAGSQSGSLAFDGTGAILQGSTYVSITSGSSITIGLSGSYSTRPQLYVSMSTISMSVSQGTTSFGVDVSTSGSVEIEAPSYIYLNSNTIRVKDPARDGYYFTGQTVSIRYVYDLAATTSTYSNVTCDLQSTGGGGFTWRYYPTIKAVKDINWMNATRNFVSGIFVSSGN